jgi:hypothetical protein
MLSSKVSPSFEGELKIQNKAVIPLVLNTLHRLGTPDLHEKYLSMLKRIAMHSISNRICLVNKNAAIALLQYFAHDATYHVLKQVVQICERILSVHFRKIDLVRFLEFIRDHPSCSRLPLKIMYKAARGTWIRYRKEAWSPPRCFFLFEQSSVLDIEFSLK